MDNTSRDLYVNALVLTQSLEKYWMLNFLSGGSLFKQEVMSDASRLNSLLEKIFAEGYADSNSPFQSFKDFLVNDILNPDGDKPKLITDTDSIYSAVRDLFNITEGKLSELLNLLMPPSLSNPHTDGVTSQRISEWLGQVHPAFLNQIDGAFADQMSHSDTIAIVADIRRSQDLITYSRTQDYSTKIIEFIANVKDIILSNNGIFDKFTGDGFIAYFNKYMCDSIDSNYYNQAWMACVRIMEYANTFFDEWTQYLRKVPEEKIGLSIGIDSGDILYTILDYQLFAVGEPCVWATRMCSAGHKGEVVFNNIPYRNMIKQNPEMNFHDEAHKTKTGEDFTCYKILI